jgi:hypothetical protein
MNISANLITLLDLLNLTKINYIFHADEIALSISFKSRTSKK